MTNYTGYMKIYLEPPDVATMPAVYVVPNSTGIQDPSGGVSPGTRMGFASQGSVELNTWTRNCTGTLLRGNWLEELRKSSIWIVTAYHPKVPVATYDIIHRSC